MANSFRIEVINIKVDAKHSKYSHCRPLFSIPVILIPGVEIPFAKLGLNHDSDERF